MLSCINEERKGVDAVLLAKVTKKLICLAALSVFLLAPLAALAAPADPGQAAGQGQDFLTIIIWTTAALSISEMIRNSIRGLFARLSGVNEAAFASKAVGAIAGVGSLFGLTALGGVTMGAGARSGASGGQSFKGQGGINLGGQPNPGGSASQLFSTGTGQAGDTGGLAAAGKAGNNWGAPLGGFARSMATGLVGGALSLATSAIPGGERLAETGTRFFDNTAGLGIQKAGGAAGSFAGANLHLLGQSLQANRLSKGTAGLGGAFQQVTGGSSLGDAMKRSMKFSAANAAHQQMGGIALERMKGSEAQDPAAPNTAAPGPAAQKPVTSLNGVRYTP